MQGKTGFKHRLFAQTARFLQLHPQVQHLAVVVVVPHRRLKLGPAQLPHQLQGFLDGVIWLGLEELGPPATAARSDRARSGTSHRTSGLFSRPTSWHRSPCNQANSTSVPSKRASVFPRCLKRVRRAPATPSTRRIHPPLQPLPQLPPLSPQLLQPGPIARPGGRPRKPLPIDRRRQLRSHPRPAAELPPCCGRSLPNGAGRGTHRSSHRARAAHRVGIGAGAAQKWEWLLSQPPGRGAGPSSLGQRSSRHLLPIGISRAAARPEPSDQTACPANQLARSLAPAKSSSASVRASSCCSGKA